MQFLWETFKRQGGSVTMVTWPDLGQFFKSAPNGLKKPQDA